MLSSGSAKARICSLRTMHRRPSLRVGGEVRRGEGRVERRGEEREAKGGEGRRGWREEERRGRRGVKRGGGEKRRERKERREEGGQGMDDRCEWCVRMVLTQYSLALHCVVFCCRRQETKILTICDQTSVTELHQ
jgi:hypothetical protein